MKQITELHHRILSFLDNIFKTLIHVSKQLSCQLEKPTLIRIPAKCSYVNPAYLANPAYTALHILHNPKIHGLSTQYSKLLDNNPTQARR